MRTPIIKCNLSYYSYPIPIVRFKQIDLFFKLSSKFFQTALSSREMSENTEGPGLVTWKVSLTCREVPAAAALPCPSSRWRAIRACAVGSPTFPPQGTPAQAEWRFHGYGSIHFNSVWKLFPTSSEHKNVFSSKKICASSQENCFQFQVWRIKSTNLALHDNVPSL